MARSKNGDYGQNGQKQLFVRKILEASTSVLRTNAPKSGFCQSSPNLCVNYFFSRALVVQGMPLHP
ncbi:MAG: hypothetical protein U0L25_04215, partial [Ligilactobacillus ruminis]|nr:hypothetical protein [Ligilactobacillus ruminis]